MTILGTFLESLLFSIIWRKKTLQSWVKLGRKVVSKFDLPETQFERTVRDKMACETHLEWEIDCSKYISGILIKFSMQ